MEINNEKEYKDALCRIGELSGAKEGTTEFEALNELVLAVETYDNIHYPTDHVNVSAFIDFRMDELRLTPEKLAKELSINKEDVEKMTEYVSEITDDVLKVCKRLSIPEGCCVV